MDLRHFGAAVFSPDGKRLAWRIEHGWVLVADLHKVKRRLEAVGWKPR